MLSNRLKIVFAGDSKVGKTTLVNQLLNKAIDNIEPNDCNTVKSHNITIDNQNLTLDLWDTTGAARLQHSTSLLYHEADILVTVFDITNKDSFETAERIVNDSKESKPNIVIILVANKSDLINERKISEVEINSLATKCDSLLQICAKDQNTSIQIHTKVNDSMSKILSQKKERAYQDWDLLESASINQIIAQPPQKNKKAKAHQSYDSILNKSNSLTNGIKELFHDYAHPPLFSAHPFRHHRKAAIQIYDNLPDTVEDAKNYLVNMRTNLLSSKKYSVTGSMARRLAFAIDKLESTNAPVVELKAF